MITQRETACIDNSTEKWLKESREMGWTLKNNSFKDVRS